MAALSHASNFANTLPPEIKASFESFAQLCAKSDILTRFEGLEDRDLRDGLSDPPTLLYVFGYAGSLLNFLILTSIGDF